MMTETNLWIPYEDTFQFLVTLNKKSKGTAKNIVKGEEIPCKPIYKIVEDELVVGILTNSNQFVQISQPIPESAIKEEYNIPSFKNTSYIIDPSSRPNIASDILITTSEEVDTERVEYIEKIKMETKFYNVFRSTIRILLNDYENAKIRDRIEKELQKEYIIYSQKLKMMVGLLHDLVNNKVQFIGDNQYYKLIKNVSTCIIKDKNQCADSPNLCTVTENGVCNLILPERNLMTNHENEEMYYGKMADELMRYSRIKSFMFNPQVYLSFGNLGYNLRENEVILLQSLITQEYFETFVPSAINKFVTNNSYDDATPQISQVYDNVVDPENIFNEKKEETCENTQKPISSSLWRIEFKKSCKEKSFGKYASCTFELMKAVRLDKDTNHLKRDLIEEYKKYFIMNEYNKDKILDILMIEGKKTTGHQVKAETVTFDNFIYADNYFLSPFDIWILVQKYKIPCIFISQQFIFETNYNRHAFVAYGENMSDKYVFVLFSGMKPEHVPIFKLIQNSKDEIFLSLDELINGDKNQIIADAFNNKINIETYLTQFTKNPTTKYSKKKPLPKVILEIDDEEEERDEDKERDQDQKEEIPKQPVVEETVPLSVVPSAVVPLSVVPSSVVPSSDEIIEVNRTKKQKMNIENRKTRKMKINK